MLTSRNNAHMWSGWHELFFVTFFCFFFFLHAASGAGGGFSSAASSYILWDAILRVLDLSFKNERKSLIVPHKFQ
jgi:hypothetical protein